MINQYLPLVVYGLIILAVGVIALVLAALLGPKKLFSKDKFLPYECGVDQMDNPHKPFALKFYVFALLFILFDVETIFLLPWAVGFRKMVGAGALPAVLFFLIILGLGLFYILKTKALEWD